MSPVGRRLRLLLQLHAGWYVLLAAVALTLLGINAIGTVDGPHAQDQTRWLMIALGVMVLCTLPQPRLIGLAAWPLTLAITVVLVVMILPGVPRSIVPVRNGTRAWIDLKFMMLQPSELAKIFYVLALAWYLRYRRSYRSLRGLMVPFGIMLIPVALIMLEPDMGTAILLGPVLLVMLLAAGARLRHLGAVVGLGALVLTLNIAAIYLLPESMQLLQPHQRARIKATISQARGDTRYLKDVGFQQDKSVTLTGAGGLRGLGDERAATLIDFNHLPEPHNDMIFTVIAARWGLLGGMLTLGLYVLLITAMLAVAVRNRDPFARLATVGFAGLVFTQMTINVGMAIGLLPIIGITLPFVSYGGSSLVAVFVMVGLVVNFATQRSTILSRPSFEFDRL